MNYDHEATAPGKSPRQPGIADTRRKSTSAGPPSATSTRTSHGPKCGPSAHLAVRQAGEMGGIIPIPIGLPCPGRDLIQRDPVMDVHRADLRSPATSGPGSGQAAASRPSAASSPTSYLDQGPEPKPPPSAVVEANYQAVQPRAASHGEGAPQLPATTSGGGSARAPGPCPPRASRPPGPLEPSNSSTSSTPFIRPGLAQSSDAEPHKQAGCVWSQSPARELPTITKPSRPTLSPAHRTC